MQVCVSSLMPYQAALPSGERLHEETPLGPWPTPAAEFDPDLGVRSTSAELGLLQLADELGFDWVAVSEHHFLPRLSSAPMVLAGALSQRIRRARVAVLGPTLSILNPLKVAEEFATLDNLVAGRLVAGVLRGTPYELRAYNIRPEESRARFEEGVELMLRAWTSAEPFAWQGRFFQFPVVSIWPGPIQKPHPPLLVGAFMPKALDRAGRLADGFTGCCAPVDALLGMMNTVKQAARQRGRDPEALQFVMRCLVTRTDQPVDSPARPVTVGSWDQIQDDVRKMAEAGVDEVFFDVAFQPDVEDFSAYMRYMERFATIVEEPVAV